MSVIDYQSMLHNQGGTRKGLFVNRNHNCSRSNWLWIVRVTVWIRCCHILQENSFPLKDSENFRKTGLWPRWALVIIMLSSKNLHDGECAFCARFHQQLQISMTPSVLRTFKWLVFVFVLQLAAPECGRSVSSFEAVVGIAVNIKL